MDLAILTQKVEKISQGYAKKFSITRDSSWFVLKLQEEMGELIQTYLMYSGQARKKGKEHHELEKNFKEEVADVFCHTLLLAHHYKIDLEKAVKEKWLVWEK